MYLCFFRTILHSWQKFARTPVATNFNSAGMYLPVCVLVETPVVTGGSADNISSSIASTSLVYLNFYLHGLPLILPPWSTCIFATSPRLPSGSLYSPNIAYTPLDSLCLFYFLCLS